MISPLGSGFRFVMAVSAADMEELMQRELRFVTP